MLSQRFDAALVFASELHRMQLRKGTSIPYISHLLAVAALVIEHGGDEDQAIAGLLHDAVEDCGGEPTLHEVEKRFGAAVAKVVADCTDSWVEPKPPWRERKEAYLAILPDKSLQSLLVSLADKTHNARAILSDLREVGNDIWNRFNGERDGTLWYYSSLSNVFCSRVPGSLSDELRRTVEAISAESRP
jgi:(p)ppGpp synthase/HD superfamily hydrolase